MRPFRSKYLDKLQERDKKTKGKQYGSNRQKESKK
jgi:hypothetical protein